jgi:hypothetical protein
VFQILYRVVLDEVPSWLAYIQAAVIIGLMGLVYIQGTRRGIRFMPMFLAMAGIFMIDLLAYIPWLIWLLRRDRRLAAQAGRPVEAAE